MPGLVDMLIADLDSQFRHLHLTSVELLTSVPAERLYWEPGVVGAETRSGSFGSYLVQSARVVERTFGGLTANLWDDPFEWTLPETLRTPAKVIEYFAEVEATRQRGFSLFTSDADLSREIALAPDEFKLLGQLLTETLTRAKDRQQQAIAVYTLFSRSV